MKTRRPNGAPPGDTGVVEGTQPCVLPDDVRELRAAAARTGRSEAELLHEALVAFFAFLEEPALPGWVGAWPP